MILNFLKLLMALLTGSFFDKTLFIRANWDTDGWLRMLKMMKIEHKKGYICIKGNHDSPLYKSVIFSISAFISATNASGASTLTQAP